MLELGLVILAGVATAASPCILPVLPLLLGGSVHAGGRARPLVIVLGFVLTFSALALGFGASAAALGVPAGAARQAAIVALAVFGLLMMWPALFERAMAPLSGVADVAARLGQRAGKGHAGGLLLGATLGALWTPCAGPVLASVLALVASAEAPGRAATLLVGYAAGAGVPMLAAAYGGRAVATRSRALARHAGRVRQVFGVLVLAAAAAMQAGVDGIATAWLTQWWPEVRTGVAAPAPAQPQAAPEFVGIERWLNTPPLTVRELRGKVVLIDFWTFGCSNCVRTLPHLVRWHERYRDAGLVIVGVHTPEFAHEHSTEALRAAIERHGIRYAVAQDNRFRTWNAYRNRYWPALVLIDRDGRIVYRHVGEDGYHRVEREIERVLMAR